MRHFSVSPVPNLRKTTQSPQIDLPPWILTLGKAQRAFFLLFIRIRNNLSCFTESVGTIVFPEALAIAQCPPIFWQIQKQYLIYQSIFYYLLAPRISDHSVQSIGDIKLLILLILIFKMVPIILVKTRLCTIHAPLKTAVCILFTHFLKFIYVLLPFVLCMVNIQEQFIIKSRLQWREYGNHVLIFGNILVYKNLCFNSTSQQNGSFLIYE